ncbi:type VI secretion system transmembrane protein TssO [Chryseobacterium oryctis]|uniref:Type VI secretion system transmembrane protein TssO n=1 Tax=Chryseobacterium oryctis TaxID=2952618 RepID=A0ABT3HRG4_9FLAO|nr:type VI secretion system transmembrane protein TssO [Chryseobacterium oryctis]MCW3162376.1 type VI secretion system transmembrane protein TssO [Chryseobacterium oryctis]
MEVLNKKERSIAFSFFILFFIITVTVLVIAVFFNAYFPFKENSLLKTENIKMKKEMETQERFSFQLEKVKSAVDSIGVPGQNDFFNEKLGLSILADMYKQLPKDTLKNKVMYNNTIMTFKDLIDAKKEIKQLSGNQATMDSLSKINVALKAEYDKMKTDLEVCRQLYQAQ